MHGKAYSETGVVLRSAVKCRVGAGGWRNGRSPSPLQKPSMALAVVAPMLPWKRAAEGRPSSARHPPQHRPGCQIITASLPAGSWLARLARAAIGALASVKAFEEQIRPTP